jgi:mono/diheme cytochrome c family protein
MKANLFKLGFLFCFALLLPNLAQAADVALGKTLFINNCASCHNKNMKDKLTGPALGGVEGRWNDQKGLYAWIRNSQASIASGHPRAVAIWGEYKPTLMTAFPNLKDDEIASLLLYINKQAAGGDVVAVTLGGGGKLGKDDESDGNGLYYGVAFVLLAGLALVLSRIIGNLNRTAAEKAGEPFAARSLTEILTSRNVVAFVVFALVVLGGYTTVNNAVSLGRTQGYQPDQPIKFSHVTHAGLNKIECQYCHDGARRSKHSLIPGANTCLNCHKAIKVGSQYGTAELTKIFASSGYDPSTDKMIANYENLPEAQVEAIYKKWIASKYRETRKIDSSAKVSSDEKLFVEDQWSGIVSALKNDINGKIQGPIEWKQLHNLPDHAYFNHAQHVAVGQIACQKCHGEVEKMVVVKQYAPLSMGWCINCHRQTEVKFADNDYYAKTYEGYHKDLKSGKREKVTVEDIGGLECQKCHY